MEAKREHLAFRMKTLQFLILLLWLIGVWGGGVFDFFFFFDSLFHFFGCEVQVAVADPLHLKPVPVVGITTALELNL